MALPTTRSEFKEYLLRRLGAPVINIEVSDDQVDDRVDESLKYFYDYHFNGSEKTYYKHQLTTEDISNEYITLPENIIGAVRIFPVGTFAGTSGNMFSAEYQFALNDLYSYTAVSLVPYFMVRQHLGLIEEMLVGEKPIRYQRHTDRLYIDMNWDKVSEGEYIIVEAYQVIDPDTWADAWADRWLLEYASEKVKQQWGMNTKKFDQVQILGGMTYTGQQIYDEASQRIRELEEDMIRSFSMPPLDLIG